MEDCIFCKIVDGKVPSFKVYEDERFLAILDINPLSKGHTIVFPKDHYEDILDIPSQLYGYMNEIVKTVAVQIDEVYSPEGILVNQNNGKKAGQEIKHIHIHVKPVYSDTEVVLESALRKKISDKEMKEIESDLKILANY
jgi:histidine triad (HIT) family protein